MLIHAAIALLVHHAIAVRTRGRWLLSNIRARLNGLLKYLFGEGFRAVCRGSLDCIRSRCGLRGCRLRVQDRYRSSFTCLLVSRGVSHAWSCGSLGPVRTRRIAGVCKFVLESSATSKRKCRH